MKPISLTDSIINDIERQLWMKGVMDTLIDAFKFFYKMDDKPIRCTILQVIEDLSKTRKGRIKLKGSNVITAIITEFDRRHREGRIISDCDLGKFLQPKPKGDDSMVVNTNVDNP